MSEIFSQANNPRTANARFAMTPAHIEVPGILRDPGGARRPARPPRIAFDIAFCDIKSANSGSIQTGLPRVFPLNLSPSASKR